MNLLDLRIHLCNLLKTLVMVLDAITKIALLLLLRVRCSCWFLLCLFQWIVGTVGVVFIVGVVVNTPGVLCCCYGSTVLLELAWIRV